jgi:hypothetical protein
MEHIVREATERSPAVDFDFTRGALTIKGESFPEDAAAFFGPLMHALRDYFSGSAKPSIELDLDLSYFNSSSAKAFMNMFMMMEEAAASGASVVVRWHYHPDDDTMQEFGEDFALDFRAARFEMCEKSSA